MDVRSFASVEALWLGLAGIEAHPSQFADVPAWWVDGREFAHFRADGWLDLRLTKALIREYREWLRGDGKFRLGQSASDWVEVDVSGGVSDEIAGLLGAAVAANRREVLDRAPDPARVVARARKPHK